MTNWLQIFEEETFSSERVPIAPIAPIAPIGPLNSQTPPNEAIGAREKDDLRLFPDRQIEPEDPEIPIPGVPAEWSKGLARLRTRLCPVGVPDGRWAALIAGGDAFLTRWGAQAAKLGWTAHDLWGCHDRAPYKRDGDKGLCWLISGREIVAMTEDAATIKTQGGKHLTFRRKPISDEAVLAWELPAS